MWIGGQAKFLVFIPNFLSPDRSERQEETLLRREAIDLFVPLLGMLVERLLQRSVGEFHSADVRDVFALCELAIHVQARQRLVFVVLLHDRSRALLKFL